MWRIGRGKARVFYETFGKDQGHGTPPWVEFRPIMINCISSKTLGFLEEKLFSFLKTRMGTQNSSESSKIVNNFSEQAGETSKKMSCDFFLNNKVKSCKITKNHPTNQDTTT